MFTKRNGIRIMGRLTTVLSFISVTSCFCVQPVHGDDWRSSSAKTPLPPSNISQENASGIVHYAVSNSSPCVVKRREANQPSTAVTHTRTTAEIQLVSAESSSSTTHKVCRTVFASHPVRQIKYSAQRRPLVGLAGSHSYADLSPVPPQKLFPSVPQLMDSPTPLSKVQSPKGQTYLEELDSIAPEAQGIRPVPQADNYVAELTSLLHGPSPWIMASGAMVDLRPEEPEPVGTSDTYVNELQSLVANSQVGASSASNAKMLTRYSGARPLQEKQNTEPDKTYVIPQHDQGFCESAGVNTVDGLFAPIGIVGVTGHSTAPPKVPKKAKQMELKLPENPACSYMQFGAPSYYATNGYGTSRAPRNTHQFYNNPLYFEDANLERCGQSSGCLTTLNSAIQFATMAALLPYQTTANHPRECVAALPDCPTCQSFGPDAYFPKWSWKAAAVQGAAVTGLIFIIP